MYPSSGGDAAFSNAPYREHTELEQLREEIRLLQKKFNLANVSETLNGLNFGLKESQNHSLKTKN